jgi:hypothetical protein
MLKYFKCCPMIINNIAKIASEDKELDKNKG